MTMIRMTCPCGNGLQARGDYVGKRMKCPACGQLLVVPKEGAGDAFLSESTNQAGPGAENGRPRISVTCSCGRVFQVGLEHAGRRTTCPDCDQVMIVPSPKSATPVWDEEESGPSEPAAASRRKTWIIGAAAAALVLLAAGGVAAWQLWPRGKPRPAVRQLTGPPLGAVSVRGLNAMVPAPSVDGLDLVPTQAAGFVSIRFGEWWNSPAGELLRRGLAQDDPGFAADWQRRIGLDPTQIDRILVVLPKPDASSAWVVIVCRDRYERTRVADALVPDGVSEGLPGPNIAVHSISRDLAVSFHSEVVFVFGSRDAMKAFIRRTQLSPPSDSLNRSLGLARGSHTLVAGFTTAYGPAAAPAAGIPSTVLPSFPGEVRPLLTAREVTLIADQRESLEITLDAWYESEVQAREALQAVGAGRRLFLEALRRWEGAPVPGPRSALPPGPAQPLSGLLSELSAEQAGARIRVPVRLHGESAVLLLAQLVKSARTALPNPPHGRPK